MRVLVAFDSFKGSASTWDLIESAKRAAARIDESIEIDGIPVADGGEGFARLLCEAHSGEWNTLAVEDPLGRLCEAGYAIIGHRAVVDVAEASGLTRLRPDERNPRVTSTYGTGQLLRAALDNENITEIILGVGGTATNDAGAGILQALGAEILDSDGKPLNRGGGALHNAVHIDITQLHPRLSKVHFRIATDVQNPLCGELGATFVYGPQKGACPDDLERLDRALSHYAMLLESISGRSIRTMPGSGAGGGTAAALLAFASVSLEPGIELVLDLANFEQKAKGADLILTGEGKTDGQTLNGKAPLGVARRGERCGVPVVVLSGAVTPESRGLYHAGVDGLFSIAPGPITLEESIRECGALMERAMESVIRLAQACRREYHVSPEQDQP